ncbi:hypothetical protein ZWY2020_048565 [Hordeum vulgare]|nr:hypothetical protein ZWY2020_048565 [Hordeum vulgare]
MADSASNGRTYCNHHGSPPRAAAMVSPAAYLASAAMTPRRCEQTPLPSSLFCLIIARPSCPARSVLPPSPLRLTALAGSPRQSSCLRADLASSRHRLISAGSPRHRRRVVPVSLLHLQTGSASSRHAYLHHTLPRRFVMDA